MNGLRSGSSASVLASVLLFVGVIAAYLSAAINGDFFVLDDQIEIAERPSLQVALNELNDWRELITAPGASPLGRPLSVASFGANVAIADGQINPPHFKVVNVLLHAVTALLLYVFSRQLFVESHPAAVTVMLIWLLMPLHVSTVLYSVQRMTQLSAMFTLLGLCVFVVSRRRWAERGASHSELLACFLWLGLITGVAVLCKENGILLPWLVVLVEWVFFCGRWNGRDSLQLDRLSSLALLLPILLVPSFVFFFTDWLGGYEVRSFTVMERLLSELRGLVYYTKWSILPSGSELGLFHDDIVLSRSWCQPWTTAVAIAFWGCAVTLAVLVRRSVPWLSLGLFFFLIAHSVESSFLPLELFFEHRNYLPTVGIAIITAGAISFVSSKLRVRSGYALAIYVAPVALVLLLRLLEWSDAERLYAAEFERRPETLRPAYLYAMQVSNFAVAPSNSLKRVVGARELLLALKESHPQSLLPCAGLYAIDTRWFPDNPEQVSWLRCIEQRLPPASVIDENALRFAIDRAIYRESNLTEVVALLDAIESVSGRAFRWDLARFKIAQSQGDRKLAKQITENIRERYSDSSAANVFLLDQAIVESRNLQLLEHLQQIYELDTRRQLTSLLVNRI
ncbi:hypothetical protein N9H37_00985 [Congregibacter sp.]|nr:hypothetical protein [Congregibacter sp.]MDA8961915.1 hypothetical protein [Congregibacter sp.]